jgi:predicted kinase
MQNKVIVLRGLPASGKSTWAKDFIDRNPGWLRVNKDDLRAMMHNSKWTKDNERQILIARDALIVAALNDGYSVIVDDTNFASHHITTIQKIASEFEAAFEVKDFDVSLSECLERNGKRMPRVPDHVIHDMYNRYVLPNKPKVNNNINLPPAIVCDLDGTLALNTNRGIFDLAKLESDTVNASVLDCVQNMQRSGFKIIFATGREDTYRKATSEWLRHSCNIKDYILHMRKAGDNRKDSIIKEEIYKNDILPEYYVAFVLDDRQQVVDTLRELGLTVFQVAPGKY